MNKFAVVIQLFILVLLLGCGVPTSDVNRDDPGYTVSFNDTGNKVFIIKRDIFYFSFECLPSYELVILRLEQPQNWPAILIVDLIEKATEDKEYSTFISIYVDDSGGVPMAETIAADSLNDARNRPEFHLLDESTLTVDGAMAFQYSYYYEYRRFKPHPPGSVPAEEEVFTPGINREVYFDNSGFLWNLHLGTHPSQAEQDNAAFDKVLESFKVLD